VILDHENDLAALVGRDRRIRNEQRLVGRAADQLHPAELARKDREIMIGDQRTAAQRTGGDVEPVVEKIHVALMRGLRFARKHHRTGLGVSRELGRLPSNQSLLFLMYVASSMSK